MKNKLKSIQSLPKKFSSVVATMSTDKLSIFLHYSSKELSKLIILISLIMFCLTGCSMTDGKDNKTIEDKTDVELSYVEDSIFTIVNKYAKDEYRTDGKLDWDIILKDAKKINDVVDTILLDLSELEIPDENIIEFSNELNNLIIAISDKNEKLLIDKLSYLYSLIPKYISNYSDNVNVIKQKELKSIILSSYNLSNLDNWTDAKTTIQDAENKYKEMMNDVDYMKENSYKLNKVYVLIEEFKNVINLENIELVNMKYINLIEAM